MNKSKILVIEDDPAITNLIRTTLDTQDYQYHTARTGSAGLMDAVAYNADVIILDLGLPDIDGMEVLREIRSWSVTPIIIISARNLESEKVNALDAGADDYITKPFGNQELLARIRTALCHHRQPIEADTGVPMYRAGQLRINFEKRRVFVGETEIRLTQIEYKLVSLLAENSGKVITYEFIIKNIWGPYADTNNRILRVNMANIRRKIEENPAVPKYIFTEVGVGYRMLDSELS